MFSQIARQPALLITRRVTLPILLIAILLAGSNAKLLCISVQANETPQVIASFADRQVAANEPIEFQLSRSLNKTDGSLAVVIGQADLTALFTLADKSLRYESTTLPLPLGESPVIVYLIVAENQWCELARFTLRVGEKSGSKTTETAAPQVKSDTTAQKPTNEKSPDTEAQEQTKQTPKKGKLDFIPSVTLSIKSQPAQSNFPATNRPDRPTFTDLNLQASFKTEMERETFNSQTQFDFVGSSFQREALRFGELGNRAPQVDLSSYLMQIKLGKVRYQAGQFSFGTSRQLMNSFSSRGMMISLPLGTHVDFALSAMNGTGIVGFGNFFGLDKKRHQLLAGTLGLEFLPKRPGGLRFELSGLNGWLQPVNSFTQGSVNDAERSEGLSFRVLASDPSQRFKLDSGFARSKFTSPSDPLLNQGTNVKPFPSLARNARYLDASYDILKNFALTKQKKANLTFAFRHERVDPLYRSLGASTQADKISNDFSLTGAIGEINAQFTHSRFNDNLNNIPSILKSLTRAETLSLGVPTASLFGAKDKPSPSLPRLSYTYNETHQFRASIPVGGGFDRDQSLIPDQVSTNQGVSADWQIQKWRVGYRLNHSFQDNRQPGKENADLSSLVNGITIGVAPSKSLDLNLDINDESAGNKLTRAIDRTLRFAPTINWRMSKHATFASNFSVTGAGDEAKTKRNRNAEFDLQWSYGFGFEKDRFRKVQGQFSIRYADRYARIRNKPFGVGELQKTQIVNLGLSFNLF